MAADVRHRVLITLQRVENDSYQFCVTTMEILCPILSELNLFFNRDEKKSVFESHLLHLLHRDKIHLKKAIYSILPSSHFILTCVSCVGNISFHHFLFSNHKFEVFLFRSRRHRFKCSENENA